MGWKIIIPNIQKVQHFGDLAGIDGKTMTVQKIPAERWRPWGTNWRATKIKINKQVSKIGPIPQGGDGSWAVDGGLHAGKGHRPSNKTT